MAKSGISWAAEGDELLDTKVDSKKSDWAQEEPTQKIAHDLPKIPEEFDVEEYIEPEPVVHNNDDGTFTKYSWKIVCDPKASPDDEDPDMVMVQTEETFKTEKNYVTPWLNDVNGPNTACQSTTKTVQTPRQPTKSQTISQLFMQTGDRLRLKTKAFD